MDNAMKMIGDIVSSLTKILVAVIGLGVVSSLGDAGLVGLLVAAILIGLLK